MKTHLSIRGVGMSEDRRWGIGEDDSGQSAPSFTALQSMKTLASIALWIGQHQECIYICIASHLHLFCISPLYQGGPCPICAGSGVAVAGKSLLRLRCEHQDSSYGNQDVIMIVRTLNVSEYVHSARSETMQEWLLRGPRPFFVLRRI